MEGIKGKAYRSRVVSFSFFLYLRSVEGGGEIYEVEGK